MRGIVIECKSLVKDVKWDKKSEKDVDILTLTSKIQELKIIFTKQSTFQGREKKNGGNNSVKNGGNSWKMIAPKYG